MSPRSFFRIKRAQKDQVSKIVILATAFAVFLNTSCLPLWAANPPKKTPNTSIEVVEANKTSDAEVVAPSTPEELEQAKAWAAQELAKAPQAGVVFTSAPDVAGDNPAELEQIAKDIAPNGGFIANLKLRGDRWLEKSEKHYRITFTLIRGIVNGTVGTAAVVLSTHVSVGRAVFMGGMAGLLSSGLQFWNGPFQHWISKEYDLKAKYPRIPRFLSKTGTTVIPYLKWFGVEVAYLGLSAAMGTLAGVPHPKAPSFADMILSTVGTAAWACASQGPWDVGFGLQSRTARAQVLKAAGLTEQEFKERVDAIDGITDVDRAAILDGRGSHPGLEHILRPLRRVRFVTDLKTVVISMISVSAAILKMKEWEHADAILYTIGAAGLMNYIWAKISALRFKKSCEVALTGESGSEESSQKPVDLASAGPSE